MVAPSLLLVPDVVHVRYYDAFAKHGFLVLDSLLDDGVVGSLFRRMRLMAALDPSMRAKYDALRHRVLSSMVPQVIGKQSGVVIVGTHPSDVDLVEYSSVAVLGITETGLRKLSVSVYGEPVMLPTEYAMVRRMIADSVDVVHAVAEWESVGYLLSRTYVTSVVGYARLSGAAVERLLRSAIVQEGLPIALMEPELVMDTPSAAVRVDVVFDYLAAVSGKWRDAVVGVLGSAPSIELAFRLPWYVVDVDTVYSMCYRINLRGVPAVSMRGESLVDLVTNRMAGAFTPGELVGTWVGALLSDRVSAEQTADVLRGRVMASAVAAPGLQLADAAVSSACVVPEDLAWVYAACSGVVALRDEAGLSQLVESGVANVPQSVELARRLSSEVDDYRRMETVAFIRRVHALGEQAADMVAEMCRILDVVMETRPLQVETDAMLVHLLPGMTYLGLFPVATRVAAFGALGRYPTLDSCESYVRSFSALESVSLTEELTHMATKLAVLSGMTVHDMKKGDWPVGADSGGDYQTYGPGFCYLELFKRVYHARLVTMLGTYPKFSKVVAVSPGWRVPDYAEAVRVSLGLNVLTGTYVLHLSRDVGVAFAEFEHGHLADIDGLDYSWLTGVSVGAQLVNHKWLIIAIVALTVAVMLVIAVIVWTIYKCRGQRRGGGGGYRR